MDKKKFGITVIFIVILVALCFGGYSLFAKNDNNGGNDNPTVTPAPKKEGAEITFASKTDLYAENQAFTINGKEVSVRKDDNGNIYINDEIVNNVQADYAYVADCIIMFVKNENCGLVFSYVVDSDGQSVSFDGLKEHYRDFRMFEGKFAVTAYNDCNCNNIDDETCPPINIINLVYDGEKLYSK